MILSVEIWNHLSVVSKEIEIKTWISQLKFGIICQLSVKDDQSMICQWNLETICQIILPLQFQYIIKQKCDENKEKHQLGNIAQTNFQNLLPQNITIGRENS